MTLGFADIETAYHRIKDYIDETPIVRSDVIDEFFGRQILFKYEGAQKTGSFKVRGALNALLSLKEQNKLPSYIVTVSSGNHAQATAYAGKLLGCKVKVFFPPNPILKKYHTTQSLGAEVYIASSRQEAEKMAYDAIDQENAFFLPPFNHNDIICGQGTSCYEALGKIEVKPYAIFATCGGGGWLSGTYLAAKGISEAIKVIGCEPELGNDAFQSYHVGKIIALDNVPNTIADGARTLKVGDKNFEYLKKLDDFVTVSEEKIIFFRELLEQNLSVPVEPTSAVALGGLEIWLENYHSDIKRDPSLVLLSGGNV